MSVSLPEKKHTRSIVRKVIVAFLLVATAIFVSWGLTKGTFLRMLQTVHSLAEPGPKLQFVNQVFREVVKLDQLQRTHSVAEDSEPYNIFLTESQHLQHMLDTLRLMSDDNPGQTRRIDSMKLLLRERDRLLLNYIRLRADVIKNDTLSIQIRRLSDLLTTDSARYDNSVVTTEKKTTTIIEPVDSVIQTAEQKQSFWDRLVGRRKVPDVVRMQRLIQEDLKIHIDTLAIAKEDSLIQEISSGIALIESDMQQKREGLIRQQMQLSRSGNMLVSQVLLMLQDIEMEEMNLITEKNIRATELVNTGLDRLKLILIVFMSAAAILLFLIFSDIVRSNKYRIELVAAKEEAEQLGKVKERFLANMSHELRTPLQTIVGTAEQMKFNNDHTPGDVDIIYQSSQHLLQSVNEVLDYSRITSGRLVLENKPFHMYQLVHEVAASIRILAQQKGLEFQFLPDTPPDTWYNADGFRLKQILYNLLGNAVKFTERGSVTFSVSHVDRSRHTAFVFSVADTGSGIDAADHEKIFNQFERATPDSQQGAGLGLTIVRELTDAFKGTVSLESERGKGSLFTVRISLAKSKAPAMQIHERSSVSVPFGGLVWVVDDDAFILNLCSGILTKYEIPHQCFRSGAELLQAATTPDVHTVLMDIRMPHMDGYALLDALRSDPRFSNTRMVALTAQAMPHEREKIRREGFDRLLMKPFLEKDLLALFNMQPQVGIRTENADDSPYFDMIRRMADDDHELIRKTLVGYAEATRVDIQLLREFYTTTDQEGAIATLHRLAGRTGQMGAGSLAQSLRNAEVDLQNDPPRWPATATIQELESQLKALVNYAREYASKLT